MQYKVGEVILLPACSAKGDNKSHLPTCSKETKFNIGIQANGVFKFCEQGMQQLGIGNPMYVYIIGELYSDTGEYPKTVIERLVAGSSPQYITWQIDNPNDYSAGNQFVIMATDDPNIEASRPSKDWINQYCRLQGKIKKVVMLTNDNGEPIVDNKETVILMPHQLIGAE